MSPPPGDSWAVRLTAVFLKCCGFWVVDTKLGERLMTSITCYCIYSMTLGLLLTFIDLYYCLEDFEKLSYSCLNLFTVGLCSFKMISFAFKRSMFLDLVAHVRNNFWNVNYDNYGADVMKKCMRRSLAIIIFAIIICHMTIIIWVVRPLLDNQGKNETDRNFPINIHINLPLTTSPWYEIIFVAQVISSYPICIAYFCFDNFLNQVNITLVGQFVILQKELEEICGDGNTSFSLDDNWMRLRFIICVQKHQKLIAFVENLKEVYQDVILGVVVLLTFLICMEMYQLMTSGGELVACFHYCVYVGGSITQLYFYTLTCDNLSEASVAMSDAAYDVRWFCIKSVGFKNRLVKDLMMVILRSQRASTLTVGRFAPVSLQTFTSICNTAFSFLTLVRQTIQNST